MDANSSEKLNIVNDTEPLTSTGGDGVPLKPQPAGTRPQQQHPTQQPGHSVPLTSHPEDAHFRESVQPDIQTFQAKLHAQKFRTTLAVLMVMNLVLYTFESIVGAALEPSAHDMILLLLGWIAQDGYRVRGLDLYHRLTVLSLVIDLLTLLTTMVFVSSVAGWHWIMWVLMLLFGIEAWFKVGSLMQCRNLQRIIEGAQLNPESLMV